MRPRKPTAPGPGGVLGVAGPTGKVKNLPCTEVIGNIMGLIGAVSGELLTRWEYDAFGNVVTDWGKLGTQAGRSPSKFSTKYLDEVARLYYDAVNFLGRIIITVSCKWAKFD